MTIPPPPSTPGTQTFLARSLADLVEAIDLAEVISEYTTLEGPADRLIGACPAGNPRYPTLAVYVEKKYFYCFSCFAKGDVATFIQLAESVTFAEAIGLLEQRTGRVVFRTSLGEPTAHRDPDPSDPPPPTVTPRQRQAAATAWSAERARWVRRIEEDLGPPSAWKFRPGTRPDGVTHRYMEHIYDRPLNAVAVRRLTLALMSELRVSENQLDDAIWAWESGGIEEW